MQVNGFQHFENKQKHIKDHKMNTHSFWWYTEILWSETIGLCKKLNIIYNIITPNPTLFSPNLLLLIFSDDFLWTGSFRQFVSIN